MMEFLLMMAGISIVMVGFGVAVAIIAWAVDR